jgi:4-diphosphocytidyl-2-C-methyl-D-erythritol kinase
MDRVQTGCKINLYLHITGVRPDGWHEIDSLLVPLPHPHDELVFEASDKAGLRIECDAPGIDLADNTLTRAWAAFAGASGFSPALTIRLRKGIPQGAGLGGGSADAAVLLRWLNARAPRPLSGERLRVLAATVGADVPFFLGNTACRALGIGDRLIPCASPLADWHPVLVCPPESVSTPWAYRAYDAARAAPAVLTGFAPQAITPASLYANMPGGSLLLDNDLEDVVFEAFPAVAACKTRLLRLGALGAVMSGSGSSVIGLFRRPAGARAAALRLAGDYGYAVFRYGGGSR